MGNIGSKLIKIQGERIFLSKIKEYTVSKQEFFYRNENKQKLISFSDSGMDYLWSTTNFDVLHIILFDKTEYNFYTNPEVQKKYERMLNYFSQRNYTFDSGFAYDNLSFHEQNAVDSIEKMQYGNFIYIPESIEEIAEKLDTVFGVI